MKRILSLILALLILLTATTAVGEDDTENLYSIVDTWYCYMVLSEGPGYEQLADYEWILMIVQFKEDGRVIYSEVDAKNKDSTATTPTAIGRWSGSDGKYTVEQVGLDNGMVYMYGNSMLYPISSGVYYTFWRMRHLDWYKDINYGFGS